MFVIGFQTPFIFPFLAAANPFCNTLQPLCMDTPAVVLPKTPGVPTQARQPEPLTPSCPTTTVTFGDHHGPSAVVTGAKQERERPSPGVKTKIQL